MMSVINKGNSNLVHKVANIEHLVGNTPMFPINNIYRKNGVQIYAKLEWHQIGGSVKSRPAFNIIKQAILSGQLTEDIELLDATSGNTGIAYASIAAALGIKVSLCLPENASEERKTILKALGVNIIYTSRFEGTDGAQAKAKELFKEFPDKYFYADQYANESNWRAHYLTTANEIYDSTKGKITHFVAGLGTTGTFTGTSRRLKECNEDIRVIALQPDNPMHGLEGWKHLETAVVPKIYDETVPDEIKFVGTLESYDIIKDFALKEGLILSPSSAANLLGAISVADEIDEGIIVTTFADDSSKYSEVLKHVFK